MDQKPKRATVVFFDDQILMECPFCGRTLIKTDYKRIKKLLEDTPTPRGKVCEKCGGVAILRLNSEGKEIVMAKLSQQQGALKQTSRTKKKE